MTIKEYQRKYYFDHKQELAKYRKEWSLAHKKEVQESKKRYLDKMKATKPDVLRERYRRDARSRMGSPKGKLRDYLSNKIRRSLKDGKGGRHWEELVGYSVNELKARIEKGFLPGMNWENYGQWHIDHIIPIAVFNFDSPEDIDFKRCWNLNNLRPLWGRENQRKGNRLSQYFQPALKIREAAIGF